MSDMSSGQGTEDSCKRTGDVHKLVWVQAEDVRWKKGGTGPTEDYHFVYVKRNWSLSIRNRTFLHYINSIISAIKRAEFDSDSVSNTVLRGRRYYSSAINVHALRIKAMTRRIASVRN